MNFDVKVEQQSYRKFCVEFGPASVVQKAIKNDV